MNKRHELGARGETMAAAWLERAGYGILGRNVRIGRSEIDIIAQEGEDTIVFVEVKTRANARFASPEANVHIRKQASLIRAANIYAEEQDSPFIYYRFDVIAVEWPSYEEPPSIIHFKDAFRDR